MATEYESVTLPVPLGGLNFAMSENLLDHLYCRDMMNMIIEDGLISVRGGYEQIAAGFPSSFPVMEGLEYGDTGGTLHTIFLTTRKMVRYTSSPTWTATSTLDLTGDDDNAIFAAPVGGLSTENLYITNGVDAIKVWTGSGNWANLTTTGITNLRAKCLIGYKGHLVVGNVTENGTAIPYRIRWSTAGNPTTWNTVTAGFQNLIEDEANSKVMCFHPFGPVLVAYKEHAIYTLTYQGDPNYFVPRMVVSDRGAISPKAVAPFGDAHLVVTQDNIHVFDGAGFIIPSPGDRIKKDFFDNLNWEQRHKIFCRAFPNKYQVWIIYPTGASTTNNAAYCWNYRENTWTKHDFADTVYSLIHLNSSFGSPLSVLGIDSNVHKVFAGATADDGADIDAYFRTKLHNYREFNSENGRVENLIKTMRRVEVDYTGDIPTVQIGAVNSLLGTVSYDSAEVIVPGDTGVLRVSKQKSGRYLTIKIANVDGAAFSAAQYCPYFEPRSAWR